MPVEFRCNHCQKLLTTPEGSAGKHAKCPACGAVVPIPLESDTALEETSWHPSSSSGAGAAAQVAPQAVSHFQQEVALHAEPLVPTQVELGDLLTRSWEVFKLCWAPCIAGAWTSVLLSALVAGLAALPWIIRQSDEPQPEDIVLLTGAALVGWWLHLGLLKYLLKLARGETALISELFSGGHAFLPSIVALVLSGAAVVIGLALCIVPGVILFYMLSQSLFVLVDRRVGPIESLRLSMQITAGNKLTLLLFGLLMWAISAAASTVTCGLSSIVVSPFWLLALAVAYLAITGQRTAFMPVAQVDRLLAPQAPPGPAV